MIEKLIRNIAKVLDNKGISYIIIGGQALLIYGRIRATRDIDLTLGIDTDKYEELEAICEHLGLEIIPKEPRQFAEQTKVLPAKEPSSKIRIDFIFSFTLYEREAIQRGKEVVMQNYPVKFASCEDLIIHKMIAGRAIDEEDIKDVLLKNRDSLDTEYIYKWLNEFAKKPEYKDLPKRFEKLLKDLQ